MGAKKSSAVVLIRGALIASVVFLVATFCALLASFETRPSTTNASSFVLLYTGAVSGVANLAFTIDDPIQVQSDATSVELDFVASVSAPDAETFLVVSTELGTLMTDCAGTSSGVRRDFTALTSGQQDAVREVLATMPSRKSFEALAPTPDPTPTSGLNATSSRPDTFKQVGDPADVVIFPLTFSGPTPFPFEYNLQSREYSASTARIQCSVPRATIIHEGLRPNWLGPPSFTVESVGLAVKMAGGGEDSIARASYDVQIGRAVDWRVIRSTFDAIDKVRGEEGTILWNATGDYWWRFSPEPLGIYQPPGYVILEPVDAARDRAILRLLAGLSAAVCVGLVVISARRYITHAAKAQRDSAGT